MFISEKNLFFTFIFAGAFDVLAIFFFSFLVCSYKLGIRQWYGNWI